MLSMKKKQIKTDFKNIDFTDTNDIKLGLKASCNPYNNIHWPSEIYGPVWNDGQKRYDCSSRGQGDGVNAHLADGDPNKIPKCPYIGPNGECQYSLGTSQKLKYYTKIKYKLAIK